MTTLYDAKNNKIGIIDSFDVLNGNLLEIVLINGCTMHFAPGDIIRDDPYGWHIRYGSYDKVPCKRSRQSTERAKKNDIVQCQHPQSYLQRPGNHCPVVGWLQDRCEVWA